MAKRITRDTKIPQSNALLALFGKNGWILIDLNELYVDSMRAQEDFSDEEKLERATAVTEIRFLRTYIFLRKPQGDESRAEAYLASGCEPSIRSYDPQRDRKATVHMNLQKPLVFTRIFCGFESLLCYRLPICESTQLTLSYWHVFPAFRRYFKNMTFAELAEEKAKSDVAQATNS